MNLILRNVVVFSVLTAVALAAELPKSQTQLDPAKLARIGERIAEEIQAGNTPGAVVGIVRRDGVAFLQAYGDRQTEPTVEKMTVDSIFDLASVTKVSATTISIHILADRGKIDLTRPVADYLPEFGANGKDKITITHCLTHTAGLVPDNHINDYSGTQEEIWKNICRLSCKEPGSEFVYSDVGMIVMGKLVERISGQPLEVFVQENIYKPLGMEDTGYNPPASKYARCVPTEKRNPGDTEWIRGKVHDPRAFSMEGVAGHAGNFSTVPDLAILGRMLLNHGTYVRPDGTSVQILSREAFDRMTADVELPGESELWKANNVRSLGWDKRSGYSSNRGKLMSNSAIGHGGWTGTSFWVDPDSDLCVIFLGTRLHPDGKGGINQLAGEIGTLAQEALPK